MDKNVKLMQLKTRKQTIEMRGKSTPGVIRKLEREIRHLEAKA